MYPEIKFEEIVSHHVEQIKESISRGNYYNLRCLPYLRNHSSAEETRKLWTAVSDQLVKDGVLNSEYYEVKK